MTGDRTRRGAAAQVFVDDLDAPSLDERSAHHLGRVLRLRRGETVVASDGLGRWVSCRYEDFGRIVVDGSVLAVPAPDPVLTVAFAPVKGERTEWVVQKLTELGVDSIVVLLTARGVVRWSEARAGAALDRLQRVALEAAAQSRRVWLPAVRGPIPLEELEDLEEVHPACLAVAEPGGGSFGSDVTAVAVGPEGGWTPGELSSAGAPRRTVSLGSHVLRTETAAIAAGTLLGAQRAGTVCVGHDERAG